MRKKNDFNSPNSVKLTNTTTKPNSAILSLGSDLHGESQPQLQLLTAYDWPSFAVTLARACYPKTYSTEYGPTAQYELDRASTLREWLESTSDTSKQVKRVPFTASTSIYTLAQTKSTARARAIHRKNRNTQIQPKNRHASGPRVPNSQTVPVLSEFITVVRLSIETRYRVAQGSTAESVLVKGVLLRGSSVFVRVGLLGLALQRAIGSLR